MFKVSIAAVGILAALTSASFAASDKASCAALVEPSNGMATGMGQFYTAITGFSVTPDIEADFEAEDLEALQAWEEARAALIAPMKDFVETSEDLALRMARCAR